MEKITTRLIEQKLQINIPQKLGKKFTTTQTLSKKANATSQIFSEDSDDSIPDPDYEEENEFKRKNFYFTGNLEPESSEVEDEVMEEEIEEET